MYDKEEKKKKKKKIKLLTAHTGLRGTVMKSQRARAVSNLIPAITGILRFTPILLHVIVPHIGFNVSTQQQGIHLNIQNICTASSQMMTAVRNCRLGSHERGRESILIERERHRERQS